MEYRTLGRSGLKVDNNLGHFDVNWDVLRVDGSAAAPRVLGSVRIAPGGVLDLGGQLGVTAAEPGETCEDLAVGPLHQLGSGIAIAGGSRVAVLRNLNGNSLLQLAEGESHEGWTLESIEALDDYTVRMTFESPFSPLLATLGLAGVTFGFVEAPGRGFNDPLILLTLRAGALIPARRAWILVRILTR